MGGGATEVLHRHLFVRHRLDHLGAGDEHVAGVAHHEHEVGDRRRVDRTTGAGAHDGADLRHHPRRQRVAQEDVGVAAERSDPFLDARAAAVVEPDDRSAVLHRQVHDLADLLGVGLRQRAAHHREVLGEDVDQAAVDRPVPAHHTVAGDALALHPEVVAAVDHQRIHLDERAGIEQQVDALVRRQLPGVVLALDALGAAAQARSGKAAVEVFEFAVGRAHRCRRRRHDGSPAMTVRRVYLSHDEGRRQRGGPGRT